MAQETFLQLWKHPNGFNPSRSTLKAYLFGITRKRAAGWWRHHRPAEEPLPSPTEPVVEEDSTLLLTDAMSRLEPDARGVLWLREMEGHSYEELAEIFEIPLGTVKSRLYSAAIVSVGDIQRGRVRLAVRARRHKEDPKPDQLEPDLGNLRGHEYAYVPGQTLRIPIEGGGTLLLSGQVSEQQPKLAWGYPLEPAANQMVLTHFALLRDKEVLTTPGVRAR